MSKISNFLYRALEKKTKVDIKIRFFMRQKKLNSACTLDSFRRGLTARRHTIDIDPPFQFVDLCSGVTGSCPVAPKKNVQENREA